MIIAEESRDAKDAEKSKTRTLKIEGCGTRHAVEWDKEKTPARMLALR